MEEDDAVGKGFGGEELEADGAMARLNEGDAFADEDGDDHAGFSQAFRRNRKSFCRCQSERIAKS